MHGKCLLEQTRRRTHDVWKAYLTFMDSTPPLLPEPKSDEESQSATMSGSIVGGGGIDNRSIVVKTANGQKISAYCDKNCGSWFTPPDRDDVVMVRKDLLGKKVLLKYVTEPSRGRVAGLTDEDTAEFIKKLNFVR